MHRSAVPLTLEAQMKFSGKWIPGLLAALAIFSAACAGRQLAGDVAGQAGPEFRVTLLDGSLHELAGNPLRVSESLAAQQGHVLISTVPGSGLRAAYISIDYDATRWQVQHSEALADAADGQAWLSLIVPARDGQLQCGIVASGLSDYGGLQQETQLLAINFERRAPGGTAPESTSRMASAAPVNPGSMSTLTLDQGAGTLSWDYRLSGDYDQNSLVSISDLTPLGIHFGKIGPFANASVESVVDGDGNGEINIGDITSIGQNFGRGVETYNIYAQSDLNDYPTSASALSTVSAASTTAFSSVQGIASAERLHFIRPSAFTPGRHYWLRPLHNGSEGIASNNVQAIVIAPEAPVAFITADPTSGIAPLPVTLDASNSTDANGNIDHYDWDFENDGTYDATTATPQIIRNYGGGPWIAKVRVVDSGGLSDTAVASMSFVQPSWNVVKVDTNAYVFRDTKLKVSGGRPCISYDQTASNLSVIRLYFIRATDTQGMAWGSAKRIDSSMDFLGDFDMEIVDGNPAISYRDYDAGEFHYTRADDATGQNWAFNIVLESDIDTLNTFGSNNSLAIIGGMPAVSFTGPNLKIYIRSATDATGNNWLSKILVSNTITGVGATSLVDMNGEPGIMWSSIPLSKVGFIHTQPVSHMFINADIYNGGTGLEQACLMHAGEPLALFKTGNPTFDTRFAQPSEPDGSAWQTPVVIGSGGSNGVDLDVINGIPMLVTMNAGSTLLQIYRADDAQASSWSGPETIDGGTNKLVGSPSLEEVSGAAAVSYSWYDSVTMQLEMRYALYF